MGCSNTSCIIIEIVRVTILEEEIDNILLPEIVFAMTDIKNLCLTQALKRLISLTEIQIKDLPNKNLSSLHYLRVLGSTIYVFLHNEKRTLKSAK